MRFRVNEVLSSPAHLVWLIQSVMVSAGWRLAAWSGPGELEAAEDLDSPGCWLVLERPDALWSLCFQRGAMGIDWWVKKAPQFEGSSGAGEVFVLGEAGHPGRLIDQVGDFRAHAIAFDRAPFGFWSAAFSQNDRVPCHTLIIDPLRAGSFPAADLDPFAYYAAGTNGLSPESFRESTRCALQVGSELFGTTEAAVLGLPHSDVIFPGGAGPNPFTGQDDSLPLVYFRRQHYKGVSGMLRWSSTKRTTGTILTRTLPKDHVVLGNLVLPWCGEDLRS